MKFVRILSNILFGLGCALAFIGLLALVLPMIENDQLQLVISSFEMPSDRLIVNTMNRSMSFAMEHCYGVMLTGAGLTLVTALLMLRLSRSEHEPAKAREKGRQEMISFEADSLEPLISVPFERDNPFADLAVQEMLRPRETQSGSDPLRLDWDSILPKTQETESPYARPIQTAVAPQMTAPEQGVERGQEDTLDDVREPVKPASENVCVNEAVKDLGMTPTEAKLNSPPASRANRLFVPDAEAGTRSQSGSRVIVRSTFSTAQWTDTIPPARDEADVGMPEREELEVPEPIRPESVSTRIRSTMGKHS